MDRHWPARKIFALKELVELAPNSLSRKVVSKVNEIDLTIPLPLKSVDLARSTHI